jgi:hypothetical protein
MRVEIEPGNATLLHDIYAVYLNGVLCNFVGSSSRRVWRCGEYVVKLDCTYDSDLNQNKSEAFTYLKLHPDHEKYFAKVYDYGQVNGYIDYVVQEYLDGERDPDGKYWSLLDEVSADYDITDLFNGQYMMIDGKPVLHDYGCIREITRHKLFKEVA